VTLAGLALRNMARNRFRVVLTALAVAISVIAFLLLRTVIWSLSSAGEAAAKDRLVTRHKVTFVLSLPKRYVEDVRGFPHVTAATWANWFGGKDPQHDREFFSTLAVDQETYLGVYSEVQLPEDQKEAWRHDRQGAIVGEVTAR
jgi:putative ABC transport system permease protein